MNRVLAVALVAVVAAIAGGAAASPPAFGRWPAGALPTTGLLHDDGRQLWSVRAGRPPRLLWTHARARLLAVAPEAHALAYVLTVGGGARLVLLARDGRAHQVDRVRAGFIASAAFLRAPGDPWGRVRLYWTRFDARGQRFALRVMTGAGPRRVRVGLRLGEVPYRVAGYPGGARLTLTLTLLAHPPRGDTLLFGADVAPDPGTVTRLGTPYPLEPAPSHQAPAWLSPTQWMTLANGRLLLYRVECLYDGPQRVVRPARRLDAEGLVDEGAWPLVPLDAHTVLAMPSIAAAVRASGLDASAATRFGARPRPYVAVDTRRGAVATTHYVYSSSDAWFAVRPDLRYRGASAARDCR
ncbi:MAG TPA: hypothetical protein VGJ77_04705 [Gaiellaceae bacterium]